MNSSNASPFSWSRIKNLVFFILSWGIVAFGMPAFSWWLGVIAAVGGYALFWVSILDVSSRRKKFWCGTAWFTAVQLVDLSWFISHPYAYIYPVYLIISLLVGLQFGFICRYVDKKTVKSVRGILFIAAFWTLIEWLRLFILSGFTWNPVGLSLTSTIYSMQLVSILGVYGLSFWVIFTNLLALRAWHRHWQVSSVAVWFVAILLPYLYGYGHYHYHNKILAAGSSEKSFKAILVQTAFPIEESLGMSSKSELVAYVYDEWKKILSITKKHLGEKVDLVALPEFVVPLGTYTFIYPYDAVKAAFIEMYGADSVKALPPIELPFARVQHTDQGDVVFVNNAFWAQGIANVFDAPLVAGLEDAEAIEDEEIEYYSAAIAFHPTNRIPEEALKDCPYNCPFKADRYEKRVLVPMGEYIPFSYLREFAASYGVMGSFTPGKEAKVFDIGGIPIGLSICYEETFGDIICESRRNGAELLVNLTSDVWYPDSLLAKQHFDHSRLRTIEGGVPLLRACNTGITCGIDSLGRVVDDLDEYTQDGEWLSDSLLVKIPTYHYITLYSYTGDGLIIGFSFLIVFFFFRSYNVQRSNREDSEENAKKKTRKE